MPRVELLHGPIDGETIVVTHGLKQVTLPLKDERLRPSAIGFRLAVYCEAFADKWCFAGYADARIET